MSKRLELRAAGILPILIYTTTMEVLINSISRGKTIKMNAITND